MTLRGPARGPFRLAPLLSLPQRRRRPQAPAERPHSTASRLPLDCLPTFSDTRPLPLPLRPCLTYPRSGPRRAPQNSVRNPSPPLQPSPSKRFPSPQPDALPEPSQSPPCQPPPHPHPHPPPHPPVPAPPATGGGGGQDFVRPPKEVRVQTGKLFIPKRRWDVRRPSGARQGGY